MLQLANKSFELIENRDGHAADSTVMHFDSASGPFRATFSGPNTRFGQAIVVGEEMLYHSVDSGGRLSAGRAQITNLELSNGSAEMTLDWRWLTGSGSSGESKWRQV